MSKSRDIADSAAPINYIDGLTSDAQGQLNDKATLDGSPTFTGTVTATAFSGDGSGLTGVDSLPSQTGNNGLFLTTDGSTASWAEAGGGAWELLSSVTATNVASASFSSLSGYSVYMLVGHNMRPTTDNKQLCVRVSASGVFQSTTDYISRHLFVSDVTTATRNVDGPRNKMNLTSNGRSNSSSFSGDIILYVHNLNESVSTSMNWRGSYVRTSQSTRDLHIGGGQFATASSNDGIQIIEEDGNNLYGTFYLYGLKTS